MLKSLRQLIGLDPKIIIIPAASNTPLTPRERQELREWLNTPLTQQALSIMEASHPGTRLRFPAYARSEWDERAAVSFLARIKGWESYRDALLSLGETPKERGNPEENYPSPDNT